MRPVLRFTFVQKKWQVADIKLLLNGNNKIARPNNKNEAETEERDGQG